MSISLKPLVSVILLINNRIILTINWLLLQTSMLQSLWNNIMVKTKMGNISSNNIIASAALKRWLIPLMSIIQLLPILLYIVFWFRSVETSSWRHDLLSLCWSLLSACGFLNHWTVGFGTPLTLQVKVTVSPSLAVRSLLEVSNIVGGTKYQIIISCYNICLKYWGQSRICILLFITLRLKDIKIGKFDKSSFV